MYTINFSRDDIERLMIESDNDIINDIFSSLPENVTPCIVGEPRVNELGAIIEEAENRVWMYRSYASTSKNKNLPEKIIKRRNEARENYKKLYNLDNNGRPLDNTLDSYEYWEGILAAARYIAGNGLFMDIDNLRTGEDLLDT